MVEPEIILEYSGHLTFSTIGRLLTMLKHKMAEKDIKTGVYKRLLSVMIEALENIYKYSDQYKYDHFISRNFIPTFKINRYGDRYCIHVSNPVRNQDIVHLRKKIDYVNIKSPEELKILYRQTISDGKFTPKGGAGLGIIEMAKISGNQLVYEFFPINDDFSRYALTITFN
ncbi:MAG TPA: SiaB family protein kinase [Bacteroidales bacterium]|nr:SiaB family protein kinase [Bacteroidales bacterium]